MKKLQSIKLNQISKDEMKKKEMGLLLGGLDPDCCGCGCHGSASVNDNTNANSSYGYGNSGGGNVQCVIWTDLNGDGKFDPNTEYRVETTC